MKLVVDTIEFASQHVPKWNSVSISRLPHPRGGLDRDAGAGLHAARRDGVRRGVHQARARRRFVRAAAQLLLQRAQRVLRGDLQASRPRAASGRRRCGTATARRTSVRGSMRTHVQTAGCSLTEQQPLQQHRARRLPGDGGRARRLPEPAHRLDGRDARACRPRTRCASRCGRSRSSPTRPASTAPSIRSADSWFVEALTDQMEADGDAIIKRDRRDGRRRLRASTRATSAARSPRRATASGRRWRRATGSSSASTPTRRQRGAAGRDPADPARGRDRPVHRGSRTSNAAATRTG